MAILDSFRVTVAGQMKMLLTRPDQLPGARRAGGLMKHRGKGPSSGKRIYRASFRAGIFVFERAVQRQSHGCAMARTGMESVEPGANGRPARPGDILAIYGTGFGPTFPEVPVGQVFWRSSLGKP
ncbi:MAG: hypothetical protein KIT83_01845 [Bryobacterales bacterium]|nr:hypothetical protein [Bryobacterales bacterium]